MTVLPPAAPGCASCEARDERIAEQSRLLEEQAAAISEMKADLVALMEEVRELRRRLGRNGGNFSMPPPADDLPGRAAPEPKPERRSGRKPGKQPGAPGAHLAWPDSPDRTVPHFPAGACACGADLAGAADLGVAASHQVVDIPAQTATVTQHDLHEAACRCGRLHRAQPPLEAGAPGTVTYGLGIQALITYLIAAHAIPVHRAGELIGAMTGAKPSPGFVHGMTGRAAAAVAAANKAIRCLIILAHVISADETPIRAGPGPKTRKRYLLAACTDLLTYYFLGDRSARTFAAFTFPGMDRTVVVHDRYQNYDAFPGLIHQLCTAHLPRDLADAGQAYPDEHWPVQITQALQGLIHAANVAPARGLAAVPDDIAGPLTRAFRHGVIPGLGKVKKTGGKGEPFRQLLEDLRGRQADVLRFATGLRIPPTSNQAERDLRPAKTQQKISGRLRSETATRNRYAIRGYLGTTRKHGHSALTAIRDALAGNPWMPPIPGPP